MQSIKFITITNLIVLTLFSMSNQAKSVTGSEHQAVVDTAYNYFNGMKNGDQQLLEKSV